MENEEWVTGKIKLSLGGVPLDLQMTVPAKPVKPQRMLPIYRQITDSFVGMSEQAIANAGGQISCRKGCAACCRQAIPLAEIEAYQIAEAVEALPEPQRAEIKKRFDQAWRHFSEMNWFERLDNCINLSPIEREQVILEYFNEFVACPLLENESCLIHEARPLACREYLVTSPAENCRQLSPEKIQIVEHAVKTSDAVRKTTNSRNLDQSVNFVPLVLALEWVKRNADEFPEKTGEHWMATFFTHLTKSGIPG